MSAVITPAWEPKPSRHRPIRPVFGRPVEIGVIVPTSAKLCAAVGEAVYERGLVVAGTLEGSGAKLVIPLPTCVEWSWVNVEHHAVIRRLSASCAAPANMESPLVAARALGEFVFREHGPGALYHHTSCVNAGPDCAMTFGEDAQSMVLGQGMVLVAITYFHVPTMVVRVERP